MRCSCSGLNREAAASPSAAVGMWKSGLWAISKGGGTRVKTRFWLSSLSTARHFHGRPRGQVRLLAPRWRILTGDSTHGKQRRTFSTFLAAFSVASATFSKPSLVPCRRRPSRHQPALWPRAWLALPLRRSPGECACFHPRHIPLQSRRGNDNHLHAEEVDLAPGLATIR